RVRRGPGGAGVEPSPAGEVRTRGAVPPRVRGPPGGEGAGSLGDVPRAVPARGRPRGAEELRGGRAAARRRLSGDEEAVGEGAGDLSPPPAAEGVPDRSARAAGAPLRGLGQAGRGGQV